MKGYCVRPHLDIFAGKKPTRKEGTAGGQCDPYGLTNI